MAGMTWSSSGEQPPRTVGRDPYLLPPPAWPWLPQGIIVMPGFWGDLGGCCP